MATTIGTKGYSEAYASKDGFLNHIQPARTVRKLERYISLVPTVAFNAVLQASWSAVAVSVQAGLLNGGPSSLVWGSLICWIGTMALAASLAEMASINPTVGAQYRWSALYAPKGLFSPAFWSLLQGWITLFAWIAQLTQVTFIEGGLIQGIVIQNYPTYIPARWHGPLIAWAVLALPLLANIFARKLLVKLELVAGAANILFFLITVIILGVMAPKSSASFVFETTFSFGGWTRPGVAWCVGLLSSAFPLQGFDGVIHMSAEVKHPTKTVPLAMISAVLINGLSAFCFIITLLFTVGDYQAALNTPTYYPIIEVYFQATKSLGGTTVLVAMIFYSGIMVLFSTIASISRLTWAFANDNGLPYSRFFSHINPTLQIPLNALLLDATIAALLLLIAMGNTSAFFAIVSFNTLALYASYLIPLIFFVIAKLRKEHIPLGPFHFKSRSLGLAINLFALCYGIFIVIFLPFPPYLPVTASNMNYGGPLLGVVILWALLDWFVSGRKRWKAPLDRKDLEDEEQDEAGD